MSEVSGLLGIDLSDPSMRRAIAGVRESSELIDALRQRRIDMGLTQAQLADVLGVRQSTISEFEASRDPRLSTVRRYALGVDAYITHTIVSEPPTVESLERVR